MPVFLIGDFNIDILSGGNNNFKQLMAQKNLLNMNQQIYKLSFKTALIFWRCRMWFKHGRLGHWSLQYRNH